MSNSDEEKSDIGRKTESVVSNVKCTICSQIIQIFIGNELRSHPDLDVPVCKRCHKFLTDSGSWTRDENGKDEQCRWCGEGGNIIECDFCPNGFCTSCIRRNIGRSYFTDLKSKIDTDPDFEFRCYRCDPKKIADLRRRMTDLRRLVDEKRRRKISAKDRKSVNSRKSDIRLCLDDLRAKIENLKHLATVDDLANMEVRSRDENLNLSTILDSFQQTSASFSDFLRKSRDLALKEEDDRDFRQSQTKKSSKSAYFYTHEAIKQFTDGFLIASVLLEKSQAPTEEESAPTRKIEENPKLDKTVRKVAHQIPSLDNSSNLVDEELIKVEILGDENEIPNEKCQFSTLNVEKSDSETSSKTAQKSVIGSESDKDQKSQRFNEKKSEKSDSDDRKSDEKSTKSRRSRSKSILSIKSSVSEKSDSEKSEKSAKSSKSVSGNSEKLVKSVELDQKLAENSTKSRRSRSKSRNSEKSMESVNLDEKSAENSAKSRRSRSRSENSEKSMESVELDQKLDENSAKSRRSRSKSGNSEKSVESVKLDEKSEKSDPEKPFSDTEKSDRVGKSSKKSEFDEILSKFDQEFRSVGQLVLKVDKLRFGTDQDSGDDNQKSVKKRVRRKKNDENSILGEKLDSEEEDILIEDSGNNLEEQDAGIEEAEEDILALSLEEADPEILEENDEEESSSPEKSTKIPKINEKSSKIDQNQSTNRLIADKQLKKLLNLRVNMNANELIVGENEEIVTSKKEEEKVGRRKRNNVIKVLSSAEEEDEEEISESSRNSSDEDFKSPRRKTIARKKKTIVDSDSQNGEDTDNDSDFEEDSDSKRKTRNSKAKPKPKGRKRRIAVSTDDEQQDGENENDDEDEEEDSPNKKGRKEIRKIKKASSLQTDAYEEERERRRRIEEKQRMYNQVDQEILADIDTVINMAADPTSKIATNSLILDQNLEKKEIYVQVDPKISRFLKPHQLDGVRFLYNCTIESVDKVKESGSGSILAHCMGLGKTFQVVAFLHTILTNERLNLKTAIVLAPVNVVLNWQHEFKHWLNDLDDDLDLNVWELATVKSQDDRAKTVATWQERGGVLILGYTLFVQLADDSKKRTKEKFRKIFKAGLLDPGPDLIICDEGHMLKNEKTALSRVLSKIKTKRRVCLTGTPLQNNLKEYYTMIQFVKPNLLGTKQEFANRFENPIKNGQYSDSTPHDVRIMKRRAHILHEMLAGCVQRQDYTALSKALPPKHEYVLSISLSDQQIALYNKYLMDVVQNLDAESLKARRSLFQDFMNLQRVWTHPYALLLHTEKMERLERIREENDFVNDDESSASGSEESIFSVHDDEDDSNEPPKLKKAKKDDDEAPFENEVIKTWQTRSRSGAKLQDMDDIPTLPILADSAPQWYGDMVQEDCKTKVELSGKCFLLFEILKKCESIGDKLLVFSQSLVALDIIESFLQYFQDVGWTSGKRQANDKTEDSLAALYRWRWARDKDYFRLDGSTPAEKRKQMSKIFNDPKNLRARLFLISTRAGSLGMNLFGANRVVVFDTNWNPTHDTQSIFRVYRFGQTKPVYIYRFIAHGTMEATIYERGVTKQSLACRVIDEQQIDRHFMGSDLEALYDFKPHEKRNEKLNSVAVPKDRLLADLLFEHKKWIITYHEHDSLLQNLEEEKLSKEEMQAAWDEYELERKNLNRYTANSASYANLVANMDQFTIYCNAMPLLRVLIDEGETLVRMSREPVQYTLESIVRSWIDKDPEVKRNPPIVLQKLEQLVSKLRIMVNAKMTGART